MHPPAESGTRTRGPVAGFERGRHRQQTEVPASRGRCTDAVNAGRRPARTVLVMLNTTTPERLLPSLAAAIDHEYRERGVPAGSCVLTARVLIDAFAYFGHQAVEQPVAVISTGPTPSGLGQMVRSAGVDRFGYCPTSRFYDGHLLVRTEDLFIDLTLPQFDDLDGSMGLKPVWFRSARLLTGAPHLLLAPSGTVAYTPVADMSHRRISTWKRPGAVREITGQVIRAVRQETP